jgi:hypothetical protein
MSEAPRLRSRSPHQVNGKESFKAAPSKEDLFFFDLNGFLHLRGVLTPDEVKAANAAIDAHAGAAKERQSADLRNAKVGTPLAADRGRVDLAGMLGWKKPHCDIFRKLLAHERLVPYLVALCGKGYRMDHLPFAIMQGKGSEGFGLHGGPLTGTGGFNPALQYRCEKGEIYNSLLAMSVQLSDHKAGDGGFCVVRGSHKMNFPLPDDFRNGMGDMVAEHLYQPATSAGDVIFFSEATVHGALPWKGDHERRIALYRFAPSMIAYGRTYSPGWPAEYLEGCTPAERAVLEPPYHNRLDRPFLVKGGDEEPGVESRSAAKKEFDRVVFGTAYF